MSDSDEFEFNCCYCDEISTYEESNGRIICMSCQMTRPKHTQKMTSAGFPVDEKLYQLIEWFIKHDIKTSNSCQSNIKVNKVRQSWIQFSNYASLERFLSIANRNDANFKRLQLYDFKPVIDNDDDLRITFSWRFPRYKLSNITKTITRWK